MTPAFDKIQVKKPNRNLFDLTHDVKSTCNMGELIPVMCMECVPGDKVMLGGSCMVRFLPLVAPVFHRFNVTIHYFAVPTRIVWPNWEKFAVQEKVGGFVPAFPFVQYDNHTSIIWNKLFDNLGLPPAPTDLVNTNTEKVSAMPFAVYQKICNDYFLDQNLVTTGKWDGSLADGNNSSDSTLIALRKRAWEHDYFTSCLPFAQKGDPVTIPVGGFDDVPVKVPTTFYPTGTTLEGVPTDVAVLNTTPSAGYTGGNTLFAQTSLLNSTQLLVNELRAAEALQEWLELNARGGTRYIEHIKAHFNVQSSDKRLQRAEYIVGVKEPVMISEILQTSSTDTTPQGNMAGHGVAVADGKYGSYFCEEHCYIMGIMSIMPKTAYSQGIEKMWLKYEDSTQYFYPKFAHLGEDQVLTKEIMAFTDEGPEPFGYLPRYMDYRFMNNRVAGLFRPNVPGSLDFWHASRYFNDTPFLNADFINSDPTLRIFADNDPDTDHVVFHCLNKVKAIRPIPIFGTPSL